MTARTARIEARRPSTHAWLTMIRTEARMIARDTPGLLIPIGLPVLFLVMNGIGSDGVGHEEFGGLTALEAISVPATLVMIMAMLGIINVPSFLATYRQHGTLRRLSATPARPLMVLVAQVVVNAILAAIGMALALVLAATAFGVTAPRNLGGAVLVVALGACALYGTGLVVAAVAPTTNAALAIGLIVFFAMMSAGGGMLPAENLPTVVARIGEHSPFGAALHALRETWMGGTPRLAHLTVLGITPVASGIVASRAFRWD